ncbi:carboxylating nicotinate-nucleotide diphosphorylase [Asticcacaulis benevestitus]|uniref:Probable nicotinate-nucleotide pyrophosphorylase [carboxylating] n=1 Tax=Asticcacaulis benevestitus DSM 16100 = ATCC BAA-896 TaxID=1121022 RepID=V4Q9R1_9CAUL|nr:carboxylating nicotinate-nucleotide diphosphorylase [Asticcacaulis benevestitus]ESQ94570.1 nicotinate-nucleotide pyrophosphorylase [Asticcacaulis benevestitus DSM 16100 = ATCC BAA-896]
MYITGLPDLLIEPIVRDALLEDLGRAGDVTASAVIQPKARFKAEFRARKTGISAGIDCARLAMTIMDPQIRFETLLPDGSEIKPGDVIARVEGKARAILAAERVALNLLCHLSGVATLTSDYVKVVEGLKTKIACTRKTLPLLRGLQKHAVKCGGGHNHRYGLDDAILIKDNHIAICGGVGEAMERAKAGVGHTMKIEIEVDSLAQLKQALPYGPDVLLLDNFTLDMYAEAVKLAANSAETYGKTILEASGGVNLETVRAIAEAGVDVISVGALTHSAPNFDIGLDAV